MAKTEGSNNSQKNGGNLGAITYSSIKIGNDTFTDGVTSGFVNFELGSPSGENTTYVGSGGSYAVVDDIQSCVYRNVSITVIAGSELDATLMSYYADNYGAGKSLDYIKNNAGGGTTASGNKRTMNFTVLCIKGPGVQSGYAVSGNGAEVTEVVYNLELQLDSEQIGA